MYQLRVWKVSYLKISKLDKIPWTSGHLCHKIKYSDQLDLNQLKLYFFPMGQKKISLYNKKKIKAKAHFFKLSHFHNIDKFFHFRRFYIKV
jgi:hypothetical protein